MCQGPWDLRYRLKTNSHLRILHNELMLETSAKQGKIFPSFSASVRQISGELPVLSEPPKRTPITRQQVTSSPRKFLPRPDVLTARQRRPDVLFHFIGYTRCGVYKRDGAGAQGTVSAPVGPCVTGALKWADLTYTKTSKPEYSQMASHHAQRKQLNY